MISLEFLEPKKLSEVKVLIMDVDGVLTDGRITYSESGEELKSFDVKDGAGLKYWHRAGHKSAIITGRSSPIVERRANELGISKVMMDAKQKLPALEEVLKELGVTPEQCVYIGDDLPDIPVMRKVAFGFSVADAIEEVKEFADAVTSNPGGRGAVRELIVAILKRQGKWESLLERYM